MNPPWLPLMASPDLRAGEVFQVFAHDQDLAVWRSEQGRVQVWENRCVHRSVRLSIGRVVGETLGEKAQAPAAADRS